MHTVVIGAGFAGLRVIDGLAKNNSHKVTLIDRHDYNFFPPLIYQVAAGFLSPSDISYPLRKFVADSKYIHYKQGIFKGIDTKRKVVILESSEISYDKLVLAMGAEPNYFGNANIQKYALPMKRLSDALAIRNRLLRQFNFAANLPELEREPYLRIVIAGGGPSGVELAGVLAEIRNDIFLREYPEFKKNAGTVELITADSTLLAPMSEKSQRYAKEKLEGYGVSITFSDPVKDYDGDVIILNSGRRIETKTLIWTAGVKCDRVMGLEDEDLTRGNRILVNKQLQLCNHPDIFAIGDLALCLHDNKYPQGHPQLGQVAMSQGIYLGKYLPRHLTNQDMPIYTYKHRGDMAMVGRLKAVAEMGTLSFGGLTAWLAWVWIHIIALITTKNRIATTYNWMIAFLTKNQSMRMSISYEDVEKNTITDKKKVENS